MVLMNLGAANAAGVWTVTYGVSPTAPARPCGSVWAEQPPATGSAGASGTGTSFSVPVWWHKAPLFHGFVLSISLMQKFPQARRDIFPS